MMRQQLPVFSPISVQGLLAGLRVCVGGKSEHYRDAVMAVIAEQYNPRDVVLTDSGTSALVLAISAACNAHHNRLIALPAYCCYDVATAADGADVNVVLYDIDPETLGPKRDSLEAAVAQDPAAVVLAHLYGVPVDMDGVKSLCRQCDTLIIEDSAQGQGGEFGGCALGTLGSLSILSFGRGKGVTGGSGGALLANDDSGMEAIGGAVTNLATGGRGTRNLVAAMAQWAIGRPAVYGAPASLSFLKLGETIYHKPQPPAAMSDTAAAIVAKIWRTAMREVETRTANSFRLSEIVSEIHGVRSVVVPPKGIAGRLRYPVIVEERVSVSFASLPARKLGVMPGYPKSLVELDGFHHRCVNAEDDFTGAKTLAERLFTFPTHGKVTSRDLNDIRRWLKNAAIQTQRCSNS